MIEMSFSLTSCTDSDQSKKSRYSGNSFHSHVWQKQDKVDFVTPMTIYCLDNVNTVNHEHLNRGGNPENFG